MSSLFADPRPLPNRGGTVLNPGSQRALARVTPSRATPTLVEVQREQLANLSLGLIPMGQAHADAITASEVYRMHHRPHLYPGWMRDQIDENWLEMVDHADMFTVDCDGCHMAVMVDTRCGDCPKHPAE